MGKNALLPLLAISLVGCAALIPQDKEQFHSAVIASAPVCNSVDECARAWAAARRWVLDNAGYRIQTYSDDYIETYQGFSSADLRLVARVTREPITATSARIVIELGCRNHFGCGVPPYHRGFDFNEYVKDAMHLTAQTADVSSPGASPR